MSSSSPVRVAIVNDYELVLAGLAALLLPYGDRVELDEAGIGVSTAVTADVDVVLVDTFGWGPDRDADLRHLIQSSQAHVVVFTWVRDASVIDTLLALGAAGYLSKALDADELVDALEAVRDGAVVVSAEDRFEVVPERTHGDWPSRTAGLTDREAEVISGVVRGLSNQEIAAGLFLSVNSIKTHIRTAYRKIGVERRSQAVAWGIDHGFALCEDHRVSLGPAQTDRSATATVPGAPAVDTPPTVRRR
jgi:NarL family two-component system response regulator LiaR